MEPFKKILKEISWIHWKPNTKELLVVILSWILVVGAISSATYLATAQNGVLYFLLYALLGATLLGIGIPVVWTVLIRKKSIECLGITKKNLKMSILIQIVLAVILYGNVLTKNSIQLEKLIPLIGLALTIGFFEAVFWRGWILQRLEDSFGLIPAILLGSLLYSLYHISYGMPTSEMIFLFFIGIMFAITFRFTKSIFILWPLFQPIGQLLTLIKDGLELPLIAVVGFIEALGAMVFLIWIVGRVSKKINIRKQESLLQNTKTI